MCEAYQEGGAEAALKQLGFDLALMAVGGGIAKGIGKGIGKGTKLLLNTKTGQAAFASADEMLRHIINDSPLLKIAFNNTNLVQKVTTKTEKITVHSPINLVTKKAEKTATKKVSQPSGKPISDMSDSEFTFEIARRADRKFAGKGPVVGTKKHQYSKRLAEQVQERRKLKTDLQLERRYKGGREYQSGSGTKDSVVPDVYNPETGMAYDYKFGGARVTGRQRQNLERQMPRGDAYKGVIEVKPPRTGNHT